MKTPILMCLVPAALILSACGSSSSSGGGGGDDDVSQGRTVELITLTETEVGTVVTIEGVGSRTLDPGEEGKVFTITGSRDADTDAVEITDSDGTTIADTDGNGSVLPDITYQTTGGTKTATTDGAGFAASENYQFARFFSWNDGQADEGGAIIGVASPADAIKTTGSATFAGDAVIRAETGGSPQAGTADAEVLANFGDGTVDVFLTSSSLVVNGIGGIEEFEEIHATGLEIDGNGFSGNQTDIEMLDINGNDVTEGATGGIQSREAAGLFFGSVDEGTPAEAGGTINIAGDTVSYNAYFIAD